MAEFHGILLFFFNVSIAYREGGWDGVGGGKNYQLGHPCSSYDASRHPHNGPCHTSRPHSSKSNLSPHHTIGTLHWCHCSGHDFEGLAKFPAEKQIS